MLRLNKQEQTRPCAKSFCCSSAVSRWVSTSVLADFTRRPTRESIAYCLRIDSSEFYCHCSHSVGINQSSIDSNRCGKTIAIDLEHTSSVNYWNHHRNMFCDGILPTLFHSSEISIDDRVLSIRSCSRIDSDAVTRLRVGKNNELVGFTSSNISLAYSTGMVIYMARTSTCSSNSAQCSAIVSSLWNTSCSLQSCFDLRRVLSIDCINCAVLWFDHAGLGTDLHTRRISRSVFFNEPLE